VRTGIARICGARLNEHCVNYRGEIVGFHRGRIAYRCRSDVFLAEYFVDASWGREREAAVPSSSTAERESAVSLLRQGQRTPRPSAG
jgi:hypothetical protein